MGKSLPPRLTACSLTASYHCSYVPLVQVASQIRQTALTGNVDRLDRLWQLLCLTYPCRNLVQCLDLPEPFSQKTLLMLATEEHVSGVVNWLMDNGAEHDGMARTSEGDTILHIAAAGNASDIISLYHSRYREAYDDDEADIRLIDWRNDEGITPLSVACRKGHLEAVLTLVSLGASVEAEDDAGNTPLHYAASYGHLAVVSRLLHLGASAFAKNNVGYSPSDVAFSLEVEQVIQDTVRSVMQVNKRLRNAKAYGTVTASDCDASPLLDLDNCGDNELAEQAISSESQLQISQTPEPMTISPPSRFAARSQLIGRAQPVLSISTTFLSPHVDPFSTPSSRSPLDLPLPSPFLDPESSKALQRILVRDQNAQAGFQAAAAYKSLVGSTLASESSGSPYSALSKESGYFSSRPHPSMRWSRSSSNQLDSGSCGSSSTVAVSSSPSSPMPRSATLPVNVVPLGAPIGSSTISSVPPLRTPPHSALPALTSFNKSSTSSFVNKLKRTGSGSIGLSPRPLVMVPLVNLELPADATTSFAKRSLEHHASLAKSRSEGATVPSQPQPMPSQLPLITKSAFGFGKARTKSGT